MFKVIKMEGDWWAVFLVNRNDEYDRYMVTTTMDRKEDAEHFAKEMARLVNT